MLAFLFWLSAGLIVYTHLGYPLLLRALVALRRSPPTPAGPPEGEPPRVSLIVAAYDEEEVIEAKVVNALALDYPRDRLELIVASDGSSDATAELARAAGADLVLELPRGGKLAAQNAAAERASGELLAFSDANSAWRPDALRRLVEPFADPKVGYACGQVRFLDAAGDNLEGAYWRYEMGVRELESALGGVTAGNGAIYAVRASAYLPLGPSGSHDLSFPFQLAKRKLRSLYVSSAHAEEKMVPTLGGGVRPQAADDGRPLGHRHRRTDAHLRRLHAPLCLRARLTPPAALPHAVPAPGRLPDQPRPAWRGRDLRRHLRDPARRHCRRDPRRQHSGRSAAHRPLLRADYPLDRRRPLGPLPQGLVGRLGEGAGDQVAMPRAADLLIATAALTLLSPLLLIAAIAIKLGSRGPVFYRQRRVGEGGREFEMLKLRTMVEGSDPVGVGTVVTRDDPRVTAAGRVLRRTSLDEIPNLVNVLRGEMAIVGPRPTIPAQVVDYTPRQHRRHEVRPGITGWAQVQGRAGIPWEERIELDLYYVDHRSSTLDFRILAKTLWLLVTGHGLAPD